MQLAVQLHLLTPSDADFEDMIAALFWWGPCWMSWATRASRIPRSSSGGPGCSSMFAPALSPYY